MLLLREAQRHGEGNLTSWLYLGVALESQAQNVSPENIVFM